MTDSRYDVIVVGSGPGGAVSAALIAQQGLRVLLLEKNGQLGGKMITISRDGFTYDLWPHGQVPMTGSAFETVFDMLGVSSELLPCLAPDSPDEVIEIKYRRPGEAHYRGASLAQAMSDPKPFFDLWGIGEEERAKSLAFFTDLALIPPEGVDDLDDTTMAEFMARYDIPYAVYSYVAFQSNASLAEPVDLVSAGEQIRIMQQFMLQGGGGGYRGGFGHLTDVITREFRRLGGEVMTGARVERITVEDGRVTGVVVNGAPIEAPIVVSSAGLQPTVLKLVGSEHFDPAYVTSVREFLPGWGFTACRYFLRRRVVDVPMLVAYSDDSWWDLERYDRVRQGEVPDEVIVFATVVDNYDPDAAPPGKQCIIAGTISTPDPEASEIEALYRKTDHMFETLWPEVWDAVERREYGGPAEISSMTRDSVLPGQGGECVGIGQVVGQCGRNKPSPVSPIEGLYYVGADAGGAGMGTHQAASSGMVVADLVVEHHRVTHARSV